MFKCKVLVQRHSSKKNEKEPRRRGNKTFIGKSDRAKQAEDWLILKLRSEKLKQRIDTITDDLNAKFTFYFPESVYYTKKGDRSKIIGDLSNLVELPADVMQKVEIIKNDTQIISLDGSRRLPIEGNNYFLEIELTKACEI